MRHWWVPFLFAFILAGTIACKEPVTETGNPCPSGDCSTTADDHGGDDGGEEGPPQAAPPAACDDEKAALLEYEDPLFGAVVRYPSCWTAKADESNDSVSSVTLSDGRAKASTAVVAIEGHDKAQSAFALARKAHPDCSLTVSTAGALKGYECAEASPGVHGGDVRDLFFCKGTVSLQITAELFDSGEAGFARILQGVTLP